MPPLNLLIKPASGLCNMRCKYCFYADVAENREVSSFGVMSDETAEILIRRAFAHRGVNSVCFVFQGGEPTLAGLPFFRRFVEHVNEYNTEKLPVSYAIQTNGYAVNEDFARFLAENRFLAGLSLDGIKDIHDRRRLGANGTGTFKAVSQTARLFSRCGTEYNILTVVTADTAKAIGRIYGAYKKNGFMYQQYIPCLDPLYEERGRHDYSLTPALFERFLKTLFDLWYIDKKAGSPIFIRYFENLLGIFRGLPPESCGMLGRCVVQHVVEADGSVYPCDFYVLDEYKIGSVHTDSFEDMERSKTAADFIAASLKPEPACRECGWGRLCRGGCRRDREPGRGDMMSKNFYCAAYKGFFPYAAERLRELAGMQIQV